MFRFQPSAYVVSRYVVFMKHLQLVMFGKWDSLVCTSFVQNLTKMWFSPRYLMKTMS